MTVATVSLHPQKQAQNQGTAVYAYDPITWDAETITSFLHAWAYRKSKLSVATRPEQVSKKSK